MHCQQCHKSLRSSEGVKCEDCDSRFHIKCVSSTKDMERGDQGYQWKCAVCQNPTGRSSNSQTLLTTINQIRDKIEVVNKIQLPKLNGDILLLKTTAERIVKQNEDILNKIDQLQKVEQKKMEPSQANANRNYRRRPLNLIRTASAEDSEEVPMLSMSDKGARYRTRQRSYHLYKVFLMVNRKLRRTRSPRNKTPR